MVAKKNIDLEDEILEDVPEEETFQIVDGILLRYDGKDEDVEIPDGVVTIGNGYSMTFFKSGAMNVTLPPSVRVIDAYAFCNCDTLESINIPYGVTTLGHHAFNGCKYLERIEIPETVTEFGDKVFGGCNELMIYAPSGSAVEQYARDNNLFFQATTEKEPEHEIEPEPEEKLVFTYEQGLKAGGKDYEISIPDGFVIEEGAEGRDFIAYIPDEGHPEDYQASRFIIFAGKRASNEMFSQFRMPIEYSFAAQGLSAMLGIGLEERKVQNSERLDLPGGVVYSYGGGCLHVNAYFGIGGCLQGMRMQIEDKNLKPGSEYEELIADLFSRMVSKEPVEYLEPLDSERFVNMTPETFGEWAGLVEDYMKHMNAARGILQNGLASEFMYHQKNGNADTVKLMDDLRDMLDGISECAEEQLKKADYIYNIKLGQYPNNIAEIKAAVRKLAEFSRQEVEVDDTPIVSRSELAAEIMARFIDEENKAYEQACREIDIQREAMVGELIKERQSEIVKDAEKVRNLRVEKLKKLAAELAGKKTEAEKLLASLGLLKVKEKKNCNVIIEECRKGILETESSIKDEIEKCDIAVANACAEAEKDKEAFIKEAEDEYPYPEK